MQRNPQVRGGDDIYFPYDVRFVDSETSPAVVQQIEDHLLKLSRLYNRIVDCRVAVGIPHKRATRAFSVHVQLDVPGKRIAASREPGPLEDHNDIQLAVSDAFHKITRQLEDFLRARQQQKVDAAMWA